VRIAVVGAGGMGSVVAAHLALAGVDTVLVGRSPEHVDAITRSGLTLRRPGGTTSTVELAATTQPASWGVADHVIVLTKSADTAGAARTARPLIGPATWTTTLQNGLGNVERLVDELPSSRVLAGTTTIGGTLLAPGEVSMSWMTATGESRTDVGPSAITPPGALDAAAELARQMSDAGLPCFAGDDVATHIWTKLALAVMGPVSAVVDATVADTWASADARRLLRTLHDEVVSVAAAEGVAIERDSSWRRAVATFEGTGQHFTSMATDLRAGRRTEVDAITGAVVERARRHGIAVPVAATVVALVHAAEDARFGAIPPAPAAT
jgi:2-dehydropantoate 2-reductase